MTGMTEPQRTRDDHPNEPTSRWRRIIARGVALAAMLAALGRRRARVDATDSVDYLLVGAQTHGTSPSGLPTELLSAVAASSSGTLAAFHVQNANTGDVIYAQSMTSTTPLTSYAVRAVGDTAGGVLGSSNSANGVTGSSTGSTGVSGISVTSTGTSGSSSSGYGVYGASNSGIGAQGTSTSNYGVIGTSTTGVGVYGSSTSTSGSHGIVGTSARSGFGGVYGLAGAAGGVGVYGNAAGLSGAYAGYFNGNLYATGTIASTIPKSAVVPFPDGTQRLLYCVESPEAWFEDYGRAALHNGAADVAFDPDFAATIQTADCHIFLTAEGASNGLYIASRTAAGFAVHEQAGGTSDAPFSYRVVGKRADITPARFAPFAPLPPPAEPPPPPPLP